MENEQIYRRVGFPASILRPAGGALTVGLSSHWDFPSE